MSSSNFATSDAPNQLDGTFTLFVCKKFFTELVLIPKFCPRDTKDQVKFFKKNVKLSNIKKNDIIYWKGHVAIALSNKKLIHAYGPMKKTVIMGINQTIKRIEKTT